MNGHYTVDDKDFTKNRKVKVRNQILKRSIMITEEQVVGFLDGNADFV
jgi:hypothetical protein